MGKRYIVYVEQVNQTYVEVDAENEAEAKEKGMPIGGVNMLIRELYMRKKLNQPIMPLLCA